MRSLFRISCLNLFLAITLAAQNIPKLDSSANIQDLLAKNPGTPVTDTMVYVKKAGIGTTMRTQGSKNRDLVSVFDYMTEAQITDVRAGTMKLDVADAIQAAWDDNRDKGVYHPDGIYGIGHPLRLNSAMRVVGSGFGTIFKCLPNWNPPPPKIAPNIYAPILSYAPMIFNQSGIQWWNIEGLQLDGNNQNCYGIYLVENFYGKIDRVFIFNTLQRPYTNIRGQNILHHDTVFYACGDGVLTWDTTNIRFDSCGFERLGGNWSYDQRHGNNKGGVSLSACWFEDEPTHFPAQGFLRMSGRRDRADAHFVHWTADAKGLKMLDLNSSADVLKVDGVIMATTACIGGDFYVNDTSGGLQVIAEKDSQYNMVKGFYSNNKIQDLGQANDWDFYGSYSSVGQGVTGRFLVRPGFDGNKVPIGGNDFLLDVDGGNGSPAIRLLGNPQNAISLESGNLRFSSAAGMRFKPAGDFEITGTGGAFYPPCLTTQQKEALKPGEGAIVHDLTMHKTQIFAGGSWHSLF